LKVLKWKLTRMDTDDFSNIQYQEPNDRIDRDEVPAIQRGRAAAAAGGGGASNDQCA
jgi:hypothetical protein